MFIRLDFPTINDKNRAMEFLDSTNQQYKTSLNNIESTITDRANEIVVRDIPLDTQEIDIRRQFLTYGNINKIILKVNGAWQTANITFQEEKTVTEHFLHKWSDIVRKDSVRIYPAQEFLTHRAERTKFCAKLCNLPKNTTGYDIENFIQEQKGKTCFIPRNKTQYNRVRYAYVNFENQQDMDDALANKEELQVKGFKIYWTQADTKTCHICQSDAHLATSCPRLQNKEKNERRITRLAELYTRKKLDIPSATTIIKKAATINSNHTRKTYAHAALGANTTLNSNQQRNTKPSLEDRITRIENLLDTALFTIQQILEKGAEEEERKALQQEIKNRERLNNQSPIRTTQGNNINAVHKRSTSTPRAEITANTSLNSSIHATNSNSIDSNNNINAGNPNIEDRIDRLESNIQEVVNLIKSLTPTISNNNGTNPQQTAETTQTEMQL